MTSKKLLPLLGWLLSAGVLFLAFLAWGQGINWQFERLTVYKFFPLLGLTAFSLMWAHYIIGALRTYTGAPKEVTKVYFEVTSFVTLLAFVLHPGLLVWQLWRDGHGLPPASYLDNYVSEKAHWAALLGTVSFFIFLAYEFRRKFQKHTWWKFVQLGSDAAMIAIFFHGLRLGRNLQDGWFRAVWIFYGISLLVSLVYIYLKKRQLAHSSQEK